MPEQRVFYQPIKFDYPVTMGSSATPQALDTAGNFIAYYFDTTATSGDTRGAYLKLKFSGAAGSGEALRAYGQINNVTVATAGTVNGAHITLDTVGASAAVSGSANALRATFGIAAASTNIGGTCAVMTLDTDIKTGATVPSRMAYIRTADVGNVGLDYFINATFTSTTVFANAGTGSGSPGQAGGFAAAKALKISVAGTDYWIPVCSTNS